MPKKKSDGWRARCGAIIPTRAGLQIHRSQCEACREVAYSHDGKEHVARCGAKLLRQRDLHAHQASCSDCIAAAWRQKPSGQVRHIARCGQESRTRRLMESHQKSCPECLAAKRENIRIRMERLNADNCSSNRRAVFSATARRTSARTEVQAARAERLRVWREKNPEKHRRCSEAMHRKVSSRSKMEMWLSRVLGWEAGYVRCGGTRKQVDLVRGTTWIEVDGCGHFEAARPKHWRYSQRIEDRDAILNEEARRRGDVTLIRLSMECFATSTGAMKLEWLEIFTAMLASPTPGVWCLGGLYESCPWASAGCTILRSPAQPTTSSSPTES